MRHARRGCLLLVGLTLTRHRTARGLTAARRFAGIGRHVESEDSMSHTPGQWRIGGELISAQGADGRAIEVASVHSRWRERRDAPLEPEAQANRALIASAPALLAALTSVRTWLIAPALDADTLAEIRGEVAAAIAQAEGRADR